MPYFVSTLVVVALKKVHSLTVSFITNGPESSFPRLLKKLGIMASSHHENKDIKLSAGCSSTVKS